ncbi:hypothetical protein BGX26_009299, partial [Mortierella sp. AD094]
MWRDGNTLLLSILNSIKDDIQVIKEDRRLNGRKGKNSKSRGSRAVSLSGGGAIGPDSSDSPGSDGTTTTSGSSYMSFTGAETSTPLP